MLIIQLGGRRFAIPTAAIIRILPMAAPTPLPDSAPGIVGVLAFQGVTLPVVDPRPRLDLATVLPHPEQHLVAIAAETRYLLWIDRAETIAATQPQPRGDARGSTPLVASHLVRVEDEHIPVLSTLAFDPGAVVQPVDPRAR